MNSSWCTLTTIAEFVWEDREEATKAIRQDSQLASQKFNLDGLDFEAGMLLLNHDVLLNVIQVLDMEWWTKA
jgi:hypothetical protein